LAALYTLHQEMFEAIEHIRLNHYHSDEVVKSLKLLARSLPSKGEAPYLLVHMHGTQLDQCRCHCSRMRASRACSAACKCSPRRLASFPTGALACVPRVPRAHSASSSTI
jgi:hypothetical protein